MNAWPPQASYPCGCFDIDIVLGSPTVQAIVRRTSLLPAQRTRTSRQTKGLPPSRSLSSSRRFRGVTRPDLHSDSKLKKNSRAAAPIGRIKAHWLRRQMKGRSLYPKAPGHAHYTQNLFTLRGPLITIATRRHSAHVALGRALKQGRDTWLMAGNITVG